MQADCPACPTGVLEYEDDDRNTCRCDDCGARFIVDESANFNGEHFVDDSAPGERIK